MHCFLFTTSASSMKSWISSSVRTSPIIRIAIFNSFKVMNPSLSLSNILKASLKFSYKIVTYICESRDSRAELRYPKNRSTELKVLLQHGLVLYSRGFPGIISLPFSFRIFTLIHLSCHQLQLFSSSQGTLKFCYIVEASLK